MTRAQILLTLGGVILIAVLYSLPRVVVENELNAGIDSHDFSITPEDAESIASLREWIQSPESENYVNFADSLARLYLRYGVLDSAASISRQSLQRDSSLTNLKKAGSVLFAVYERLSDAEEIIALGTEVRDLMEKILLEEPDDPSVKTKLAMTLVTTENPMAGITLLREVENAYPDFREAILNLGLLSIQSGQYPRGIERFQFLLRKDSNDFESRFYLGICFLETDSIDMATELFESIANTEEADPALRVAAREYLEN